LKRLLIRNAGVKNRETERVEQTRRGKITQGFIRREVRDQMKKLDPGLLF
jgi:hypothetical protein